MEYNFKKINELDEIQNVVEGTKLLVNDNGSMKQIRLNDAVCNKQDTLINSGANAGQIAMITDVDDNGKPVSWEPVDMPTLSDGGYGYSSFIPFDECMICDPPVQDDEIGSDGVVRVSSDGVEGCNLIIGHTYEVSLNGVSGTYTCYDDDGYPTIGFPWDEMEMMYPGKWQIFEGEDGVTQAYINLRPIDDPVTFSVKEEVRHKIDGKYLPEGGNGWTETVKTPLVCENGEDLGSSKLYDVRLGDYYRSNYGETYHKYPFEIQGYNREFDNSCGLHLYTTSNYGTQHNVVIKDHNGNNFIDDTVFRNQSEDAIYVENKFLQPGEHYTVILDGVEYSYVEEEVVHKIDEKYLPEVSSLDACIYTISDSNDGYHILFGNYAELQQKAQSGDWLNIALIKYNSSRERVINMAKAIYYQLGYDEGAEMVIDFTSVGNGYVYCHRMYWTQGDEVGDFD